MVMDPRVPEKMHKFCCTLYLLDPWWGIIPKNQTKLCLTHSPSNYISQEGKRCNIQCQETFVTMGKVGKQAWLISERSEENRRNIYNGMQTKITKLVTTLNIDIWGKKRGKKKQTEKKGFSYTGGMIKRMVTLKNVKFNMYDPRMQCTQMN